MQRPPHPSEYSDDPVVRQTLSRLRFATIAIVAGIAICIMLAGLVARLAFDDGVRSSVQMARAIAEAPDGSGSTSVRASATGPSQMTYGLLVGGFFIVGFFMFVVVRRPYEAAREHAVELVRAYRALQESTIETIAALNATVEAKDRYTAGHGLRVTLISLLIGQELGLDELEIDMLRHAATFHDIGKIAVPDEVLSKPGRLTDSEFEAMKVHPVESARICSKVAALRDSVPSIRHHHERLDGRGYPDGIAGDRIPLGARIIAVADTWDAITSDRPYRRGQAATVALDEIRRATGGQFDHRVVNAFIEVLAKDPWMFGLEPADLKRKPAAPGRVPEGQPRSSERGTQVPDVAHVSGGDVFKLREIDVDWSTGFDDLDEDDGTGEERAA